MPILDAFQLDAVQALFGSSHASHIASSWTVDLFDDDPRDGGAVLPSTGGYAALTVANDDTHFPVVDGTVTPTFVWAAATAAWGASAEWLVFSVGGVPKVGVPLAEPVSVGQAGTVLTLSVPLFFDDVADLDF